MEFKKSNRQRVRQPLTAPSRGGTTSVGPRIVLQPVALSQPKAPEEPTPQSPPASRIRRAVFSKKGVIALGVIGCLIVGLLVRNLVDSNTNANAKKPTYQTVLPKGKSISALGGWKRVSPPNSEPVFAFADAIDGVAISVTEQPLPQSFKNNAAAQTAEVAKKFNATDKVEAGDIDVYVGTSAKGPQSVIFTKGNLLVLIKSEKKIKDTSWAAYAQTLN